ncbi:DUF3558 domain-containing protein [Nocardia sp. NPDC051570]|uniref:DUF3558 domain-containing protein n=1 Tax=Nocardia sp. NPDC051570 TaxID=3364324 RepID=UPI00378BC859
MQRLSVGTRFAAAGAAALTLAACGSGSDSPPNSSATDAASTTTTTTSSARPTLTDPKLQPPSQDNQYTRGSGRPKVVFDPCTWIPDDALAKLGYDPSTRKRMPDVVAEYTFFGCQVTNPDGALQLVSGNISLEEDKQKFAGRTQDVTINGRETVIVNKLTAEECDLDMRTKAGYFEVAVIIDTPGLAKGLKPCDHIVEVATALEPFVGKDN